MTYQKSRDSQKEKVNNVTEIRKYIFLPKKVKCHSLENVGTVARYVDSS